MFSTIEGKHRLGIDDRLVTQCGVAASTLDRSFLSPDLQLVLHCGYTMTFLQRTCKHFMQLICRKPSLCVLIWCLVLNVPYVVGTGNEIDDAIDAVWDEKTVANGNDRFKVEKQWGVPDTTAYVGKLFRHHIPADAFIGNVHHFEVNDAYNDRLPKWLYFNNGTATLEGVPTSQDIGHYHISVAAVGISLPNEKSNSAQDVFAINVVQEEVDSPKLLLLKGSDASPSLIRCPPLEEFTTMSITLDANFLTMEPTTRVELAKKVMEKFGISKESLQFLPVEFGQRLYDGNTIMAGPGNAQHKQTAGMIVQWQIGCGHMVNQAYEDVISTLEKNARDGSLAKFLEIPVIGWHLEAVQPTSVQRQKRQLSLTQSTPVPWPLPTQWMPTTDNAWETEDLGRTMTDDGPVPESRIIPTMSSPTFTYATTAHKHRHSHYLNRGYHPHRNADHNMITASHGQHYIRLTHVFSTPVPTPVFPSHPVTGGPGHDSTDSLISPSMMMPELPFTATVPISEHPYEPTLHPTFSSVPTRVIEGPFITSTHTPPKANFRPVVRNRVQKLVFIAGKVSRFMIPAPTFFDFEDGDTRNLKLKFFYSNGTLIPSTSWIHFDPQNQEIQAIPLEINIGKWSFSLEAEDSDGGSVKDDVEIHVRQHQSSRVFHHEFEMHLKYDKWRFSINLEWQMLFISRLVSFFGDANDSNIIVHSFTTPEPFVFTWTNESLQLQRSSCPLDKVNELLSFMSSNADGSPSKQLRKAVAPQFRVTRVYVKFLGHCKITGPHTPTPILNTRPVIRNRMNQLNATVGRMLHEVVPEDTFFDEEDGNTYNLKLSFYTIKSEPIPHSSWIQFNSLKREFIGLPLMDDVGSGEYRLQAIDKHGSSVGFTLVITVVKPPDTVPPNIEFSLRINHNYTTFLNNLKYRLMVLDKLIGLFGDNDTRYISVQSITKGSVAFNWINTTLQGDTCPVETIQRLISFMLYENGTITQRLINEFSKDFNVTNAMVIARGACMTAFTTIIPIFDPTPSKGTDQAYSDDDIYITTIIPAVVIAAMLLIAAIIACVLYRKKRKGKMTMEDSSTFVNKGIPIIFADELEDKPDPAKSPVIMKEEKPPMPPPEYHHSSSSASPSTPPLSHQKRDMDHLEEFGLDQSENSPPYQPPPPFTSNRDSRLNRPKHTPTYRLPPPYVPP